MNEIDTDELRLLLENKHQIALLDCRGVDYHLWEHIPGALNMRWTNIESLAPQVLKDLDQLIITSCASFNCSASTNAYRALKKLGYRNLREYSGGLIDWKAHKLPTISSELHRIASNVYRFPGQKFYDCEVGCYLIEEDDFILLIDGPQELTEEHADFIAHFDKRIIVFLTHDATGGGVCKLQENYAAKIYLHRADQNGRYLNVVSDMLFADDHYFSKELRVIATPGHTPGSACLYDSRNKILFSGDTIAGTKTDAIRDFFNDPVQRDDYTIRFESLLKLKDLAIVKLLPFHYQMILEGAGSKLQNFIRSRNEKN